MLRWDSHKPFLATSIKPPDVRELMRQLVPNKPAPVPLLDYELANKRSSSKSIFKVAPPGLPIPSPLKSSYSHNWASGKLSFRWLVLQPCTPQKTWACHDCWRRYDNEEIQPVFNHAGWYCCEACAAKPSRRNGDWQQSIHWNISRNDARTTCKSLRAENEVSLNNLETPINECYLEQVQSDCEGDEEEDFESNSEDGFGSTVYSISCSTDLTSRSTRPVSPIQSAGPNPITNHRFPLLDDEFWAKSSEYTHKDFEEFLSRFPVFE